MFGTCRRPDNEPKTKRQRCQWCREFFDPKPNGRPQLFCGQSCRQRAYEKRKQVPRRLLAPASNAAHHDLIMMPPGLARRILDFYRPFGRLSDTCRGAGAFYRAMRRHSDDVRWCEITEGRDFLTYSEPVDWIISNPPWSKFRAFLRHAMTLAPNVVFLATITHFVTKARLREIHEAGFGIGGFVLVDHPPPPWPVSGFQLAAVRVQRGCRSGFSLLESSADRTLSAPGITSATRETARRNVP